jgi:hypothetical protein
VFIAYPLDWGPLARPCSTHAVNHRGVEVVVAQQLLNRANVIAIFQQMRGDYNVIKPLASGQVCIYMTPLIW